MRRPVILLLALAGAAMLLAACQGPKASGNVGTGPATGDAIKISATDNKFSAKSIDAPAGQEVTVEITNAGDTPHNFVIDDLGISTGVIKPGEVATATFTMPRTAAPFECTLHRGMNGELTPA